MPEDTMVEGSPADSEVQSQTTPGQAGSEDTGSPSETELISENEEQDAAEKRIQDLQKGFQEKAEEAARLKEQMENLKAQADQASAIKELVETLKPKEEPDTPEWEAVEREFVAKGWDEDEAKKQVEALRIAAAWQQQGEAQVEQKVSSKIALLEQQLAEEKQQRVKLSNDYIDNQELVDEMVANGMDLNAAIPFAKKMAAQMPAKAPGRPEPPPAVGGGRVTQEAVKTTEYLSEADKVDIANTLGRSMEELEKDGTFARMEEEHKARVS